MGDRWRILGLEQDVDEPDTVLRGRAARLAGVAPESLRSLKIVRRSVDARVRGSGRRRIRFVVHVEADIGSEDRGPSFEAAMRGGRIRPAPPSAPLELPAVRPGASGSRAVVVGSGPAGQYAALVLARHGVQVDLIDRGASLETRGRDLVRFRRTRVPDPESNLLFGEGGAGTYSDGKLYTRIDDPLEVACLEELVAHGAPPDILFDSRAHIGTDRLHRILPRMRRSMIDLGVRFHWGTRLDALATADHDGVRSVRAVRTTAGEIPCDALFLALGHSARDTVRALVDQGLSIEAKPFQLGVRIEHPQALINAGRYGRGPEAAKLGAAAYNLVNRRRDGGVPAHSFCMCPGGKIVASVNAPGQLCTNGMSNSMHSSPWANAAIVVTLGPREYGDGPWAGVAFQQGLEERFFEAGGGDYTAPAQRADDFLAGRESRGLRRTSYGFGVCPGRIDRLLPERVRDALAAALRRFDRQIAGYAGPEGLLVGLESRSSGPLRMPRDRDTSIAVGFDNLYPIGEGAGFAGGIMSAAIDGARAAQRHLAP